MGETQDVRDISYQEFVVKKLKITMVNVKFCNVPLRPLNPFFAIIYVVANYFYPKYVNILLFDLLYDFYFLLYLL